MKRLLELWLDLLSKHTLLVLAVLFLAVAGGIYIALQGEIEAFPDVTNVQVQVITQFPGKAAEEVERQLTIPLEVATIGTPGLINQRSISLFGLSVITLTFDDQVILRQVRLDVNQRLQEVDLPEGLKPMLSPESSPVGEVFRYTVEGDLPPDELRAIEDFTLERAFRSIPGVADVVSFGGPSRSIEVRVDIPRIKALGLTVANIAQTLGQNHANAGGSIITHGEEGYLVRSLGLYDSPESIESAVIATAHNTPVRVRDVGSVRLGHLLRLGQVGRNDEDDAISGIILLRRGYGTLKTCEEIRKKIAQLNDGILPPGVKVVPYYDRTRLIDLSSETVFENVFFGIVLVVAFLGLGFGIFQWRLVLAVSLVIPFALLLAFVGVNLMGHAPNLISLGAVDFGIIVETAIFAAEAVATLQIRPQDRRHSPLARTLAGVLGPALLCAFLLLLAFIPILSLQRVEGRIFKPLGITLVSALLGGQLGALIFIPLLCRNVPQRGNGAARRATWFDRGIEWVLSGLSWVPRLLMRLPWPQVVLGLLFAAVLTWLGVGAGREFLPQLNEGALWVRVTAPASISRETSIELASQIRSRLREIPEVTDVVSQIGRPDDGTDINGFDNVELFVRLKPPSAWTSAPTIDGFIDLAQDKLKDLEGVTLNFSQPIKDNVDEAISGVKGELVVKVFGTNLQDLQDAADRIAGLLRQVPGAEDVGSERLLGQPELSFRMDRNQLARYGLQVSDAEDVLESALLGKPAARFIDDQGRSFPILVKPNLPDPPDVAALAALPVFAPGGAKVPLGEVAHPRLVDGVIRVYRESGERRIAVKCSVRGRPVVEFVAEASQRIADEVKLPPRTRLQWSGSFENAQRAGQRLLVIVPLCLVLILMCLHTWFGDLRFAALLLWEVPFSAVGGLLGLRIAGLNLSISAACGGIVLIGVSLLTGMMLIAEWQTGKEPLEALRAKWKSILLSSGVAIIGLIPAAVSHGIGSETARPFAVMILSGLISSLLFTVILLPVFLNQRQRPFVLGKPS